jgi:hypothetical protein
MSVARSCLLFALAVTAPLAAADSAALFNGRDLAGWALVTTPAAAIETVCHLRPDGVIAIDGKPSGFLQTAGDHRDFQLHVEWRWPGAPGNGGVLVHISSGPKDRVWPLCFQVQTKHKSVGDLLPMAGATLAEPLAPGIKVPTRPRLAPDSEKPAGEWNICDIICRGDTIEVTVNGVLQNRATRCAPAAGRIGFQLEGTPFELRHVTLAPL